MVVVYSLSMYARLRAFMRALVSAVHTSRAGSRVRERRPVG